MPNPISPLVEEPPEHHMKITYDPIY